MRSTSLLRRGLGLEYVTLGWNVVGTIIILIAAVRTGSAALAGFGLDSAIEIFASIVVVWQLKGLERGWESLALKLIGTAFIGPGDRSPPRPVPCGAHTQSSIDEHQRIIGAKGKRPVLRNLGIAAVEHFRGTREVIDLVGVSDLEAILAAVRSCSERDPGLAPPSSDSRAIEPVSGSVPTQMSRIPRATS